MFENVGGGEVLLILIVILIFFGPKKIPELAQSLGKGLRKFNDARAGIESQVKDAFKEPLAAVTDAKQGFEQSMRTAAAPLQAELNLPQNLTPAPPPPTAPAQPPVPEAQARGTVSTPPPPEETTPSASVPEREA